MNYSQGFLQLQLDFACHLALISDQPLSAVLTEHTVLRHLLDLEGEANAPNWQGFVQELQESQAPGAYLYASYRERQQAKPKDHPEGPEFGCFSYVYPYRDQWAARIHFQNRDTSGHGALSRERIQARTAELGQMFRHIREAHPDAEEVWGGSWLYNLEAYRRLFPMEYVAAPTSAGYETGYLALWGQFVGRDDGVREPPTSRFMDCVRQHRHPEACLTCFPFVVLRVKCRIEAFYHLYGVGGKGTVSPP